ncbi:DUF2877 domain-containing protein [Paenibacillus yanchengensis]|uniref:DUF2877 domain-containing protein n=1 Tax=Paenibacillus yanchengensis TaxID=2035833 RepID=A0ABW4YH88_9BACL
MTKLTGNEKVILAKEYEQRIPLLLSEHSEGYVHSVFQNGVNIQMGGRLFFIGTTKNGQLPFGIHLDNDTWQQLHGTINQQTPVRWLAGEKLLLFKSLSIVISLTTATTFVWQLSSYAGQFVHTTNNLTMLISILLENTTCTGLDLDIEQFLTTYLQEAEQVGIINTQVDKLITVLSVSDGQNIESSLRFFLGRGQGLTPSGDDHLIGLLAVHAVVNLFSKEALDMLWTLVVNEQLTTDVSREYLIYALEGKFSSTVVEATVALTQPTNIDKLKPLIERLLDTGHSSGTDTVFGMLLGLLIKRRKLKWQKK